MPLCREGRGESQGRDYCSMLPINHPEHFTQFHISQIRLGWQCVTATQKEGETWMPSPAWSFLSCVLIKEGSTPRFTLTLSPPTFSALTLPGERLDIRHLLILAKEGHYQPLMPKSLLTCYLTNTALALADEPSPKLKTISEGYRPPPMSSDYQTNI